MLARNAAIARGEDPDKIKVPNNNGGGAGLLFKSNAKRATTEEQQEAAKKQYLEIFASEKTYEVRLRNKALALRKGKFMGMANRNSMAVFESKRQIVAVPADKLHKRVAGKVEDQIEKAKKVYKDTGVAFDDVLDVPDSGDKKDVGLAGREKITMYVFTKPKKEKEKKSEKQTTAKDKEKSESKG